MNVQMGDGSIKIDKERRFKQLGQTEEGKKLISTVRMVLIFEVSRAKGLAYAFKGLQIVGVNDDERRRKHSPVPIRLQQQLAANRSLSDIRPASIRRETSIDSLRHHLNSQQRLQRSSSIQVTLNAEKKLLLHQITHKLAGRSLDKEATVPPEQMGRRIVKLQRFMQQIKRERLQEKPVAVFSRQRVEQLHSDMQKQSKSRDKYRGVLNELDKVKQEVKGIRKFNELMLRGIDPYMEERGYRGGGLFESPLLIKPQEDQSTPSFSGQDEPRILPEQPVEKSVIRFVTAGQQLRQFPLVIRRGR